MKLFPKIINGFYSLNIFAKKIILEYASANFSKVAGLQPAVGGVVYICFVLKGPLGPLVILTHKILFFLIFFSTYSFKLENGEYPAIEIDI